MTIFAPRTFDILQGDLLGYISGVLSTQTFTTRSPMGFWSLWSWEASPVVFSRFFFPRCKAQTVGWDPSILKADQIAKSGTSSQDEFSRSQNLGRRVVWSPEALSSTSFFAWDTGRYWVEWIQNWPQPTDIDRILIWPARKYWSIGWWMFVGLPQQFVGVGLGLSVYLKIGYP